LIDTDPMRPFDMSRDRVAPGPDDVVEARTARVGVPVDADDEAPVLGDDVPHEPFDQVPTTAWWHVLEIRADEIEVQRRCPRESVAHEDALGPAGQAGPRERRELRHDVEAVWLDS